MHACVHLCVLVHDVECVASVKHTCLSSVHVLHTFIATPGHSVSHHHDDHHLKPDSPVPAPRKTRAKEKPKEREKV